ncbi:hypothetical protein [Desulforamulus hydrothermalis]|nr:hypothetical protein [Desulforamulus hydrothermalis]
MAGLRTDSTMIRYSNGPCRPGPMAFFAHQVLLPVLRQVADRRS